MAIASATIKRITFKGEPYLLIPSELFPHGAIATPEQFENFEDSYAHWYSDGRVLRYQQQIGTDQDIVVLGDWES